MLDGGRNPEVPRARSKVKDEGFGVLNEPVGKEGVTSGHLMRLDAFQTLQPRPAVLPFNGRLIGRGDSYVRDVEAVRLISVEI